MKRGKRVEWTRLDNAAKIFPPTSNDKDTKVFRFVCELQDEVSPDILQLALITFLYINPYFEKEYFGITLKQVIYILLWN